MKLPRLVCKGKILAHSARRFWGLGFLPKGALRVPFKGVYKDYYKGYYEGLVEGP